MNKLINLYLYTIIDLLSKYIEGKKPSYSDKEIVQDITKILSTRINYNNQQRKLKGEENK